VCTLVCVWKIAVRTAPGFEDGDWEVYCELAEIQYLAMVHWAGVPLTSYGKPAEQKLRELKEQRDRYPVPVAGNGTSRDAGKTVTHVAHPMHSEGWWSIDPATTIDECLQVQVRAKALRQPPSSPSMLCEVIFEREH
jgi:hypothetical protein